MRRIFLPVAALLLQCAPAAHAAVDSLTVARLAVLGQVWGTVKFFNPALAHRDIDWDAALIGTIPLVESARSESDLAAAFDHLLSVLDDSQSCTWTQASEDADALPSRVPKETPAVVPLGHGIVRVVATDWQALLGEDPSTLADLLKDARGARGIVLDLRNRSGSGAVAFGPRVEDALPVLLDRDLALPALRTCMHSGYPPGSGSSSGGYETGVFQRALSGLAGTADRPPPPIVVLVNRHSRGTTDVLSALQCAGLAKVILEGDRVPWPFDAYHWISVSDSVGVILRTSERVNPDGTVGFHPDVEVPEADPEGDLALKQAVTILRGKAKPSPKRVPASPPRRVAEKAYADLDPVPREYRLLGLFRMWNIIRLFYPYHELLDRPWDDTLVEFIPRFEAAGSKMDYLLTARELAVRMQDSHANVWSPDLAPFGKSGPALAVRRIEGRWVIEAVADSTLEDRVSVGDVVLAVDGEPSEARARRLAPYMPASTPQALDWRIARALLSGDGDASLELENGDGTRATVTVPRGDNWNLVHAKVESRGGRPVFQVLPEGFGYIDLDRLERSDVSAALEAVAGTPGLVFDMRGYPQGTAWLLGSRLASAPVTAARFRRPVHLGPEEADAFFHEFEQKIEPFDHWGYEQPIAVLINEDAVSQAEHTCLYLEAATGGRATFIGTPTNGANGDVTNFPLPGGLNVSFTGHDVRHGDGRQLQRVGIQPDVVVAPTIAGTRRSEDEVLAAAVRFLRGDR